MIDLGPLLDRELDFQLNEHETITFERLSETDTLMLKEGQDHRTRFRVGPTPCIFIVQGMLAIANPGGTYRGQVTLRCVQRNSTMPDPHPSAPLQIADKPGYSQAVRRHFEVVINQVNIGERRVVLAKTDDEVIAEQLLDFYRQRAGRDDYCRLEEISTSLVTNFDEYRDAYLADEKRKALGKLTAREREMLGLTELRDEIGHIE